MAIFFKKSETANSLEYKFIIKPVIFYVMIAVFVVSLVLLKLGIENQVLRYVATVLMSLSLLTWLAISASFGIVRFVLTRKVSREGGKIILSTENDRYGSAAGSLWANFIVPGSVIRWEK